MKSEEFVRFHCDQEDQIDDYKRLKKIIHDNGLPSIEQMIALQRQVNECLPRTSFLAGIVSSQASLACRKMDSVSCLVPVRRLPGPCWSMHFGDVSETKVRDRTTRSETHRARSITSPRD